MNRLLIAAEQDGIIKRQWKDECDRWKAIASDHFKTTQILRDQIIALGGEPDA